MMQPDCTVYVGTYTGPASKGIYACQFDSKAGKISAPVLAAEVRNPSFLAVHPNGPYLYAANETQDFAGQSSGAVSSFSITRDSGQLTLLNQVSSQGVSPCHVAIDRTGTCLLAANYRSGSVALMGIWPDGKLEDASAVVKHTGVGVHPTRQQGPHAHSANPDPGGRFALVADLGIDKIMVYALDPVKRTLSPASTPSMDLPPGHGPRHLAFHPSGRVVYVMNELASTISMMAYDPDTGRLTAKQDLSTLPAGYTGASIGAEVRVSPSGRHVYVANRGHNSIASFTINPNDGTLSFLEIQSCGGDWPRHFAIDPSGEWMVVANERSNTIVLFRIDQASGKLTLTGECVSVPSPTSILFLSVGR